MRKAVTLVALFFAVSSFGQQLPPDPESFLGYKLGTQFTTHDRILGYFHELARTSNLITVEQFGETYEHRPLVLATITSPKNRTNLDAIRRDVVSLSANADTVDAARANQIAANTPAVVWLAFGVHGNESSSSEAAMQIAGTLLRDPQYAALLDNIVVLIDPLQNPDGRERYVQWYTRTRGVEPDANPESLEQTEPWPRGRYNHYLIDMNRDWTWMSQRETAARVAMYQHWFPQVFIDFHEMGYRQSYFFPPVAKPVNVNFLPEVQKWFETFGRANAEAFTQKGWPFFVSEDFDFFYPGYGDSWPSLHGAVGMTYEVAGTVGIAVKREDGSTLTLADRIARHTTTGLATVRTAAANREGLLKYTYAANRARVENGKNVYLIEPGSPNVPRIANDLRAQGIRVQQLAAPLSARATRIDSGASESHSFPAGTLVVTTRQPFGALAQTLLERNAEISPTFLEEQQQRTETDEPDQFYDITAWSMPLAMNADAYVVPAPLNAQLADYQPPAAAPFREAAYGYIVDALEPHFYELAGQLLSKDVKFSVFDQEVDAGSRRYARGSIIVLKGNNANDLDRVLAAVSKSTQTTIVAVESGWMGGMTLGSQHLTFVKQPNIAIVGGPGTDATSYGMLWHTLDVDVPVPHSNISADAFARVDLDRYGVIVLPSGRYTLSKEAVEKLRVWLRNGGTIVAVRNASALLRDKDTDISKLKLWEPPKKKEDAPPVHDELYNQPRVPGAAFRTTMNTDSYLTFGVPKPPAVLIQGATVFLPVSHKVDNIVTIAAKDPLVSGVAFPESLDRLKGSAYLVSEPFGKGNVITFADEPHFRLFWRATLPLFLNAVIYSPSFPR
ncbi:MAG TPA: M14 family metallopeptidase [Thermoanaerobaculia bacterium]|nr:M14 family metallopeptidase [Thermoanaerobaculia bacterium]